MKNKKGEGDMGFGSIIMMFVGIIFALALMGPIFDSQSVMTTKPTVTDETVSVATAKLADDNFNASFDLPAVTNTPTVGSWQAADCPLEGVVVSNASGTALTVTTDYTFDTTTGILNIINNSDTIAAFAADNDSLIDYSYCHDGYITNSGGRGVTTLIGVFAALALLGFVFAGLKGEWFN